MSFLLSSHVCGCFFVNNFLIYINQDLTLLFKIHSLRVTLELRGCPLEKNSYAHHFKGKQPTIYHLIGKLNKCRFWKKIIAGFFNSANENCKMTRCHSIELIAYQIQAHWQNKCTVLITKDQSSKVCQHFSIF